MSTPSLTSLADALAVIRAQTKPLAVIKLPLSAALHSVLAEPVTTPDDIPAFARSAMDGYAVHENPDTNQLTYSIQGEVHTAESWETALDSGTCVRIATGAAVPDGTSRIIPKELAKESADRKQVTFESLPDSTFIRLQGEDAHAGETLLAAGDCIKAGDLSLLATLGITSPAVIAPPVIAHLATGDEIVAPEKAVKPGQIRDSNSILVRSFLQSHHLELRHQSRSPDHQSGISRWIDEQSAQSDVLLISGGASVGPRDYPPQVLEDAGFRCEFSRLNLRPGKPVFFGKRDDTYAFVLPGNPGSHLTVLRLLVLPLLQILCGRANELTKVSATIHTRPAYTPNQRHTFLPGRLRHARNGYEVFLNRWSSSGDVVSLARANCLVEIPAGSGLADSTTCIPLYESAISEN